jgi:hypothetical protein
MEDAQRNHISKSVSHLDLKGLAYFNFVTNGAHESNYMTD